MSRVKKLALVTDLFLLFISVSHIPVFFPRTCFLNFYALVITLFSLTCSIRCSEIYTLSLPLFSYQDFFAEGIESDMEDQR